MYVPVPVRKISHDSFFFSDIIKLIQLKFLFLYHIAKLITMDINCTCTRKLNNQVNIHCILNFETRLYC